MSSQQSRYGAIEVAVAAEAPAAATPGRARGLVLALALCAGGALFAVAGPGPSPRLRGTQLDTFWTTMGGVLSQVETDANGLEHVIATLVNGERVPVCPSGITALAAVASTRREAPSLAARRVRARARREWA